MITFWFHMLLVACSLFLMFLAGYEVAKGKREYGRIKAALKRLDEVI